MKEGLRNFFDHTGEIAVDLSFLMLAPFSEELRKRADISDPIPLIHKISSGIALAFVATPMLLIEHGLATQNLDLLKWGLVGSIGVTSCLLSSSIELYRTTGRWHTSSPDGK